MANEILIFDAAGSNVDGTDPGASLTVGPGTSYRLRDGTSFPAAPLDVLYATSIDTVGELAAARRYGNRTLTVKLGMIDPAGTLLAALQAKLAKFQREGGTIKRTLKNGDVRIYDIVAANEWTPNYDWAYWRSDFTEVEMSLPAMPLSRGVEVDLGDNVETTLPVLVFTDTGVAGDVPGLGRLVVDNDGGSAQRSLFWGIQSRYYDAASTAALFYQAESCLMITAAAAAGPAGASGAGSNVARHTSLPITGAQLFYVGAAATQTHVGTFRVIGRVQASTGNTGTVSLRLDWKPYVGAQVISNDTIPISNDVGNPIEGSWTLVDFGMVALPKATVGSQGWSGYIVGSSTSNVDDIDVDWVGLVPVDEGSGYVGMVTEPALEITSGQAQIRHDGVFILDSSTFWRRPDKYEGDYLMIPPAGAEARTIRLFIKGTEQQYLLNGTTPPSGFTLGDINIDDISARLFYTPRYLT